MKDSFGDINVKSIGMIDDTSWKHPHACSILFEERTTDLAAVLKSPFSSWYQQLFISNFQVLSARRASLSAIFRFYQRTEPVYQRL